MYAHTYLCTSGPGKVSFEDCKMSMATTTMKRHRAIPALLNGRRGAAENSYILPEAFHVCLGFHPSTHGGGWDESHGDFISASTCLWACHQKSALLLPSCACCPPHHEPLVLPEGHTASLAAAALGRGCECHATGLRRRRERLLADDGCLRC